MTVTMTTTITGVLGPQSHVTPELLTTTLLKNRSAYNYYKIILQWENLTAFSALRLQNIPQLCDGAGIALSSLSWFSASGQCAFLRTSGSEICVSQGAARETGQRETQMTRFSGGSSPVWLRVEASLNLGQAVGGGGARPSAQPEALSTGSFFLIWEALALLFRIFSG